MIWKGNKMLGSQLPARKGNTSAGPTAPALPALFLSMRFKLEITGEILAGRERRSKKGEDHGKSLPLT